MEPAHAHQCVKCGHVWKHVWEPSWTQAVSRRAHVCPECGHYDSHAHYLIYKPYNKEERDRVKKLPVNKINLTVRMFEVFYDGVDIGLVAANDMTVENEARELCKMQTQRPTNRLWGVKIKRAKISYTDRNAKKFQHML